MNGNDFKTTINKLKSMGCIKESTRAGKVTFSLLQAVVPTPILHEREEDMYSDFVDFKIYVTETLSTLNEKVIKMDSTLELKALDCSWC